MPTPQNFIKIAAAKRAGKLRAKGLDVNFDELMRMEPNAASRTPVSRPASIGSNGSVSRTAA